MKSVDRNLLHDLIVHYNFWSPQVPVSRKKKIIDFKTGCPKKKSIREGRVRILREDGCVWKGRNPETVYAGIYKVKSSVVLVKLAALSVYDWLRVNSDQDLFIGKQSVFWIRPRKRANI